MVLTASHIVARLLEAEDLDAPDLEHWGQRLSVENRLTKLFGPGQQYMKGKPDAATKWQTFWRFGPFMVSASFVVFYKNVVAPSGNFSYDLACKDWQHHDSSDWVQGPYILKVVELVEQAVNELNAKTPTTTSAVTRAFYRPISYAYHKVHYPNETYEPE